MRNNILKTLTVLALTTGFINTSFGLGVELKDKQKLAYRDLIQDHVSLALNTAFDSLETILRDGSVIGTETSPNIFTYPAGQSGQVYFTGGGATNIPAEVLGFFDLAGSDLINDASSTAITAFAHGNSSGHSFILIHTAPDIVGNDNIDNKYIVISLKHGPINTSVEGTRESLKFPAGSHTECFTNMNILDFAGFVGDNSQVGEAGKVQLVFDGMDIAKVPAEIKSCRQAIINVEFIDSNADITSTHSAPGHTFFGGNALQAIVQSVTVQPLAVPAV